MKPRHIVIIGGGITGLSAAHTLYQRMRELGPELQITVLERENQLGGKIRTHREGGFVMEEGPDSLLARKPAGVRLIEQLGVTSEIVNSREEGMKTYIVHNGRLQTLPARTNMGIPAHWPSFFDTPLLSSAGKLRALLDLVLPPMEITGDVSIGAFLRRRLGDELVDHLIEPLLGGIYAGRLDDLSLLSTYPQFRQLEQKYGSLIRGSMRQRQAAPTLTSNHGRSVFITLKNGLQTLVERLHDELHPHISLLTQAEVTRIEPTEGGAYRIAANVAGEVRTFAADAIICTAPAQVAATLLSPIVKEAQALADIPYVSTAVVLLGYQRAQLNVDLDGAGFLVPRKEGRTITACTWTSSKWPHTTPEDQALVRCYVGRAGQQEALALPDDELLQRVMRDLADITGLTARPWFTRVVRWNAAMPQFLVHHQEKLASVTEALATHAPGLFLAGAGYHAVGIPDCIANGEKTAEAALAHIQSL
ncbi:protoporphyrinogen oxidase [Alicyclobacillus contaminans]|uniref:protoporphyrinogen oxidase n=1 Tax=Alicyclobacillus contaminans TaxID=392016 RepID=UPI00042574AD|nr:protoporphyrinogen oxidase [Alicyclobacillus contaminans]GMA51954.1 protoporphyrinogen oxidase [Alicyclobacillus contaminans]